ncbi:MAG TPA: hypothetical protein VGR67_08020 [Candidatus Polarisedimenticolia bacterium]|nr:hypothetical protein [Candidatus Polarisedimenticolia bacterium]
MINPPSAGAIPSRRRPYETITAALLGLCSFLVTAAAGPALAAGRPPKPAQSYGAGKVFKPEFKDLVRHADLIVVGRVSQIGGIPHPGPSRQRPGSRKYAYWEDSYALLEIEQVVKGKAPGRTVRVAFHSDLEGDKTNYQAGKKYIAFLLRPTKYPDSYTTAHFHYGQYRINDQGKAERVADPSEISKPSSTVIDSVRQAMGSAGKGS